MEFEKQKYATAFFRAVEGRALVLGEPHDGKRASWAGTRKDGTNTKSGKGLLRYDDTTTAQGSVRQAILEGTKHATVSDQETPAKKQGTLMGVYLPVVTSMWGVLIFIRYGVIAGYTGWVMAIGFCFLSAFVQTLTTLSLCTVLSNSRNYKGGSFGILKRNLGGELAGVVCLLYYLGMTCLASIELLGSVQALSYLVGIITGSDSMTGNSYWDQVFIGGPLLFVLAAVRSFDVRFVHGMTAFILIAVLASFFFGFVGLFLTAGTWRGTAGEIPGVTGISWATFMANALPDWNLPNYTSAQYEEYFRTTEDAVAASQIKSPAAALAILFPTFLGIFQGANKANDLASPNQSIIRGTTSALGTSLTIYLLLFLLLAAVADRNVLKSESLIFANLGWPSQFVGLVGTVLVGLGACVSLLEIGPTILHAVAEDGLYSFLQYLRLHERKSNGEPVYAVFVSFTINFLLLFVSTAFFETLASVVTMFFLQAYAQMHLALLLNEVQQHASWRPIFRFYHWSSALIGFATTVILMLLINWVMALITISLAAILMLMVKIIEEPRRKGIGTRALGQGRALGFLLTDEMISYREHMQALEKPDQVPEKDQEAFWEPQVLCLLEEPEDTSREKQHLKMLHFTEQLSSRGLLPRLAIVASLVQANKFRQASVDVKHKVQLRIYRLCNSVNLRAFPQAVVSPTSSSLCDSYLLLMQSSGLGCLHPNLVLVSWQNKNLLEIIRHARFTEKVIAVLKDVAPLRYKRSNRRQWSRSLSATDWSMSASNLLAIPLPRIDSQASASPDVIDPPYSPPSRQSSDGDLKKDKGKQNTSLQIQVTEPQDSNEKESTPPHPLGEDDVRSNSGSSSPASPMDTANSFPAESGSSPLPSPLHASPLTSPLTSPVDSEIRRMWDDQDADRIELRRKRVKGLRSESQFSEDMDDDELFDDEEEDYLDEGAVCLDTMEDLDSIYASKRQNRRKAVLQSRSGTIDIWWIIKNGGLPVILANILKSHRVWKRCKLRVFAVVEGQKVSDVLTTKATVEVKQMLEVMRVHAVVEVIQVNPVTHSVVRTTIVDEDEVEVVDSRDDGGDEHHTRHGHHTLQVILEHPFDEDDERPFRVYHHDKVPTLSEIFPEQFGPTGEETERRKKKAQALRDKALALYHSLLTEHSPDAELVVLNLPHPSKGTTSKQYQQTLQRLTDGINRVLFVHSCLDDDQLTHQIVLE